MIWTSRDLVGISNKEIFLALIMIVHRALNSFAMTRTWSDMTDTHIHVTRKCSWFEIQTVSLSLQVWAHIKWQSQRSPCKCSFHTHLWQPKWHWKWNIWFFFHWILKLMMMMHWNAWSEWKWIATVNSSWNYTFAMTLTAFWWSGHFQISMNILEFACGTKWWHSFASEQFFQPLFGCPLMISCWISWFHAPKLIAILNAH